MSRYVVIGLLFTGIIVLSSTLSYSEGANDKDRFQYVRSAAVALKDANPVLSKKLTQFADQDLTEAAGGAIKGPKLTRQEKIKLLDDAIAALKEKNPFLSDILNKYADKERNKTE